MTDKLIDKSIDLFIKKCTRYAHEEEIDCHVIDSIDLIIRRCIDKDDPISSLDHYLSGDQVHELIHLYDDYRDNYYRFTLLIKAVQSLNEYTFVSELKDYIRWLK